MHTALLFDFTQLLITPLSDIGQLILNIPIRSKRTQTKGASSLCCGAKLLNADAIPGQHRCEFNQCCHVDGEGEQVRKLITLIVAILLGVSTQAFAEPPPIKVEGGTIQGATQGPVDVWLGIPYAAPPVGKLRWTAPQPVKPWLGTLVTDTYGPLLLPAGCRVRLGRLPDAKCLSPERCDRAAAGYDLDSWRRLCARRVQALALNLREVATGRTGRLWLLFPTALPTRLLRGATRLEDRIWLCRTRHVGNRRPAT